MVHQVSAQARVDIYGQALISERNVQGTNSCLQDGDQTDGHYITLVAEQLTITFEVLVYIQNFKQIRPKEMLLEMRNTVLLNWKAEKVTKVAKLSGLTRNWKKKKGVLN